MILVSPLRATVASVEPAGSSLLAGAPAAMLESMKMEHPVCCEGASTVTQVFVAVGEVVDVGQPLLEIESDETTATTDVPSGSTSDASPSERADLTAAIARHEVGLDSARPEAVARRRERAQRTARENIAQLCDDFVEYGPLVVAAQRRRRDIEELIERTPADGLVCGIGRINSEMFSEAHETRSVVLAYDATVLAGTQGAQNHRKKDRMFDVAARLGLPVVFFTEGGGGRPGDVDVPGVSGLDCLAFRDYARLSGLVPTVAVVAGRCFAGNAALAGTSDVVIATESANLGMAGPAMIEGGGLGVVAPEEIGPAARQHDNGVIDVLVPDEEAAVDVAARYVSYFQGTTPAWSAGDQLLLRDAVPERRTTVYDVRSLIEILGDDGSVLELRPTFGPSMITALIRIEGRPLGVIANNPASLGGAIDADAADTATRMLELCNAHGIAVLSLCDTPGMMVGPAAEDEALVRRCGRMFVAGAHLSVPLVTVVLRKCYGLGAQAMAGGTLKEPLACVAWPTAEFGGMGLEGAVRLGFKRELDAIADDRERESAFAEMVERAYEHGSALNVASHFEIDDVIDPADTRRWIVGVLPPPARG